MMTDYLAAAYLIAQKALNEPLFVRVPRRVAPGGAPRTLDEIHADISDAEILLGVIERQISDMRSEGISERTIAEIVLPNIMEAWRLARNALSDMAALAHDPAG